MRDINTVPVEDLTNEELIARARHLDKMLGNDVDDTILELVNRLEDAQEMLRDALPSVKVDIRRIPSDTLSNLVDRINKFLRFNSP